MKLFTVGDRVRWARDLLRSHDRNDVPGVVKAASSKGNEWQVCSVLFDDGVQCSVLSANLIAADRVHLERG